MRGLLARLFVLCAKSKPESVQAGWLYTMPDLGTQVARTAPSTRASSSSAS